MEDEILFPEIALFHSNCKQSSIAISKISKSRRRRQKIKARLLKAEGAMRKETPPCVPEQPPPPPSVQEVGKKMGTMEYLDSVLPPLSLEVKGMSHDSERVELPTAKLLVVEESQMKKWMEIPTISSSDSGQGCRYGLRPRQK